MKQAKILSALMAIAIVATPAISGKANYDSKVQNYQIVADAAKKTGWVESKGYWYYYDKNGKKIKNQWKKIDGHKFYFDKNGRMLEGTWKDGKYLFPELGIMVTGCAPITFDTWYNFDSNGNRINVKGWPLLLNCNQNIYSSTSTNSNIKGKLKKGELVFYTDQLWNNAGEIWCKINYEGRIVGYVLMYDSNHNALADFTPKACYNAACYKFALMKSFECVMHNDVFFDEFLEPVPNSLELVSNYV